MTFDNFLQHLKMLCFVVENLLHFWTLSLNLNRKSGLHLLVASLTHPFLLLCSALPIFPLPSAPAPAFLTSPSLCSEGFSVLPLSECVNHLTPIIRAENTLLLYSAYFSIANFFSNKLHRRKI